MHPRGGGSEVSAAHEIYMQGGDRMDLIELDGDEWT